MVENTLIEGKSFTLEGVAEIVALRETTNEALAAECGDNQRVEERCEMNSSICERISLKAALV